MRAIVLNFALTAPNIASPGYHLGVVSQQVLLCAYIRFLAVLQLSMLGDTVNQGGSCVAGYAFASGELPVVIYPLVLWYSSWALIALRRWLL